MLQDLGSVTDRQMFFFCFYLAIFYMGYVSKSQRGGHLHGKKGKIRTTRHKNIITYYSFCSRLSLLKTSNIYKSSKSNNFQNIIRKTYDVYTYIDLPFYLLGYTLDIKNPIKYKKRYEKIVKITSATNCCRAQVPAYDKGLSNSRYVICILLN